MSKSWTSTSGSSVARAVVQSSSNVAMNPRRTISTFSSDATRSVSRENLVCGDPPVERDDRAARVGGGSAQVQALDRGARLQTAVPHLAGQRLALEDVAAGQAD